MRQTHAEPLPSVTANQLARQPALQVIDLRTPSEFAEDHVPGACNVPLFDDVERALIGTLYARRSPTAAFDEALARTHESLPPLVKKIGALVGREVPETGFRELVERLTAGGIAATENALKTRVVGAPPGDAVVLNCWRGGLRSRGVAAFLRQLGWTDVHVLESGYKAYRRRVIDRLAEWDPPPNVVLRGLTGVGKTLVLRALEVLCPQAVLDLEALAGHRSSILGMVGLEPCSQRTFESRLLARVEQGFPAFMLVEGESRKVGNTILPQKLWDAMQAGTSLELVAPLERRIQVLCDDYLEHETNRAQLAQKLPFIEERLGPKKWKGELVRLLEEHREGELVEVLLERYYDPLYSHSEKDYGYAAQVDASEPEQAARQILDWVQARCETPDPVRLDRW